jgi:hypothetical protein
MSFIVEVMTPWVSTKQEGVSLRSSGGTEDLEEEPLSFLLVAILKWGVEVESCRGDVSE